MKIEHCRSCPAEVIWAVTERGKRMPVDAAPSDGGNVELVEREGAVPLARVVHPSRCAGRDDLRISHFATCPEAGRWRRDGQS